MEYFILRQDYRVSNYPRIKNTEKIWNIFEDVAPIYCETKEYTSLLGYIEPPFLNRPCFIVSNELRKLFSNYQDGGEFRPAILDGLDRTGVLYYFYQPFLLECLSDQTTFFPGKTVKKLVLSEKKIKANKVFQLKGLLEKFLIVDLEILELMLCGGIYPVAFEHVNIERREYDE